MIAGHAFGEPALLVHVEPNWFAVGAKCTHYSAPLADGVLRGAFREDPKTRDEFLRLAHNAAHAPQY